MIRPALRAAALALLPVAFVACSKGREGTPPASAEPASATRSASAEFEARSGSGVTGRATFEAADGGVTMVVEMEGLTPGEHAMHLHNDGDCSAPDFLSAGAHWNPTADDHGRFGHDPFHRGDIGNFVAGDDGSAALTFSTDLWTIGGDPETDVVGRAVILHDAPDDFTTQPTGNAGGRVACGVIREVD